MHTVVVDDFKSWREKARELLYANIQPDDIAWNDEKAAQQDLFGTVLDQSVLYIQKQNYVVPKAFLALAETVACHQNPDRWQKLYKLLWRLTHGEKNLLSISSDALMHELLLFEKAVRRDCHKMKAFVRFRLYQEKDQAYYVAWHEPDHNIIRRVAPFFKRRFAVMLWTIITPFETVIWDGESLQFVPGVKHFKHPREDELENLWRTYYQAIFNPARIKLKAMRNEMPQRYWKNMPETAIIQDMLLEAPARVQQMMKYSEGLASSAKDYFPAEINWDSLKAAANHCQACPIYQCAKQTVFGSGALQADIMVVGEQPGQQEDNAGLPLIGPSGKFVRDILQEAGFDCDKIYFTNAVKHFKHDNDGSKIIYQTPKISEINACKPWLGEEIKWVKPKIILTLGLVAAKSLISGGFHMKQQHGKIHYVDGLPIIPTYHPAAILRTKDKTVKASLIATFKASITLLKDS